MSVDQIGPSEEDASKQPRTSVRVLNKQQQAQQQLTTNKPSCPALSIEEPSGPLVGESSSKKRTWEQWCSQDERTFYEALSDCAKNFESIREYFVRQKKTTNKTKGQIRTFYYRTWHKISRYINFPDGLSKSTKELYGLINYGELRRRLGGKLDEKNCVKLQELVFNGSTTLRIKGKTVRVKTPMCPALKRLNNHRKIPTLLLSPCRRDVADSDTSDGSKRLPRSLSINLTPLTNDDFIRVHGKALQNPKLSLGTDLQRTIGSVVKYLEQKWRNKVDASSQEKLTLIPKPGVTLKKPIFLPVEPLTSEDLSLGKVTQEEREDEDHFYNHLEEDDQEDKMLNFPWNSDCSLSVGEIYLMLGCGAGEETEVELNYTFKGEEEEKPFDKDDRYRTLNTLIKLVHDKFKKSKPLFSLEKESSNDEDNFRRPAAPTPAATAFKQQLDLLLPKYNNRKGRPMSRKNANARLNNGTQHQRLLQPKFFMPSSKSEVKLRLLPQVKVTHPVISIQQPLSLQIPTYQVITTSHQDTSNEFTLDTSSEKPIQSPPLSPTESVSSLKSTDRFLDSVFENSNSSLLQTPPRLRSRPSSPFICEGSSSMSWSFPSSFTEGSLNFKSSRSGGTSIMNEDSSHSTNSEVDRQLLSMMTESSVDFTSKFAKLASHITSDV